MNENKNIIVYRSGEIEINVSVERETIWLSAEEIAKLFNVQRPAIVKHIGNIYKTHELSKTSTCSVLEQVAKDGKKRKKNYYNLDIIISVGYRVNSIKATQFRIWATTVLKQYIYKGYTINSEKITHQRFKELENDVSLLKYQVDNIFKALEDKSIKPKQGIFYNGQVFDAYLLIADFIKSAKKSIFLIDNYPDETVLAMLDKRKKNCKATIYTKKITKQLQTDIEKHNAQYPEIELKKLSTAHDRFLIIDSKTVYHFGASLKDTGKKWFAFSKLDINAEDIIEKL
jgi:hypothetical protein